MGADRTAPVVLGPVTWVHLARHANAEASEEATIALKDQYLDAILPVYAVSETEVVFEELLVFGRRCVRGRCLAVVRPPPCVSCHCRRRTISPWRTTP